jgi:hypothetical protein
MDLDLTDNLSISSKTNTGFDVPAFFKLWRIPASAFLYRFFYASFWTHHANLQGKCAHILYLKLLRRGFTHTCQTYGDFISFRNFKTAKCSIILFFTSSNPKWSRSKIFSALIQNYLWNRRSKVTLKIQIISLNSKIRSLWIHSHLRQFFSKCFWFIPFYPFFNFNISSIFFYYHPTLPGSFSFVERKIFSLLLI